MEGQERTRLMEIAWEFAQKYPPVLTSGAQYNPETNQTKVLELFDKAYRAMIKTVTLE